MGQAGSTLDTRSRSCGWLNLGTHAEDPLENLLKPRKRTASILVAPEKSTRSHAASLPRQARARRVSSWRESTPEHGLGILVHGCHLEADGWHSIVWGEPPNQLGRLPHAALMAWEERASLVTVCFGTGASQTSEGELEGAYTLRFMYEHFAQLANFPVFAEEVCQTTT
jgi:hypothetical protein